jgi:exodeoxyribonuclease VII large subunit
VPGFVSAAFRSNVMRVSHPGNQRSNTSKDGSSKQAYLSITEVTTLFNDILETSFPQLLFRGEISQMTVAQSGHMYFTLKDEGAQVSCVVWSGVARTLTFKPSAGKVVLCHGRPNVYGPSGRLQIIVHRLLEDGQGALQQRFLELKARLEREGFFAPERKRQVPRFPKAVGLVTSRTGAVLHDMMVKIRERFPSMIVYLSETRVQGEGAAGEIAQAIHKLDRSRLVDVMIVARGGGSLEDLWAFNEEEVVKAVFACGTPVVSGVGHEVDTTLCDLVADVRAPTPTAAAELVVPKASDLLAWVGELERRLKDVDRWLQPRAQRVDDLCMRLDTRLSSIVEHGHLRLKAAEAMLSGIRPDRVLDLLASRVTALAERLVRAGEANSRVNQGAVEALGGRLQRALPPESLQPRALVADSLARRLDARMERLVEVATAQVGALESRLTALDPVRVLERGFSIVRVDGRPVRSISEVRSGAAMEVTMVDGTVSGTVSEVTREKRWQSR